MKKRIKQKEAQRERSVQIKFFVNEDEKERILKKASTSLNLSDYLRKMALNGKVIIPAPSIDRNALLEMNRIGVNINQIVKKINESDVNVFSRAIRERLLKELEPLERLLDEKVTGLYNKVFK